MHNPVVLAAVRGCLDAGWAALRFNFAGVGASGGRYSGGDEEVHDVAAAAATLRDALPAGAPLVDRRLLVRRVGRGACAAAMSRAAARGRDRAAARLLRLELRR